MGLLGLLTDELKGSLNRLHVAHVQHMLRVTAGEDARVVSEFAQARGITVSVRTVNVPDLARRKHLSLEAAARQLRYQALSDMADESKCQWILTAHTMDDSAETVLMRMRSGAAWYEWTGIPARRGRILRPLLFVRRSRLREWVKQHEVPYREDESNDDLRFRRNRLRNMIAQSHEFWNDTYVEKLHKNGHELDLVLDMSRRVMRFMPDVIKAEPKAGRIGLAIDEIFRYFNNLTFLPVEAMWSRLADLPVDSRLPSRLRKQVIEFLKGTTPDARLMLLKGITLVRRGRSLWLVQGESPEVSLPVGPGEWRVPERNGCLVITDAVNGQPSVRLTRDILERRLTVRTWQPGDRIKPVGRPRKKVADLLAERKLDPVARARTLVLCDEDGPLMIVGGAVDERAAAKDSQGGIILIRWTEDESRGAVNDF